MSTMMERCSRVRVRYDADGWPESIPWPEPGDFVRFRMDDFMGRCCLSGWAAVACFGRPSLRDVDWEKERGRASNQVHDRMMALAKARGFTSYIEFNNAADTTDEDRAEFWRETWEHFGYRVTP